MKNRFLKSVTICAGIAVTANAFAYNYVWQEAETGAEYNPIVVKSDLLASNDIYLAPWTWGSYGSRSESNGIILFEVDVPEAGQYSLWGRVEFPWSGINPYDVATGDANVYDDSLWQAWSKYEGSSSDWTWSNSQTILNLSAGKNTIKLVQTEGGPDLKIDKILLTDDLTYTPENLGESEPVSGTPSTYTANTVAKNGQLQVIGTQLSDQSGNPVQLQGISTHGLQWFPLIDNQTIPNMAEFFGAEVVRLAMYIEDYAPKDPSDFWGGYMADPEAMKARVRSAIEDAINAGIYVIVDWHIHNIPTYFTDEANAFFDEFSRDYGDYPNVIYEIANEPLDTADWDSVVYPYAETIIDTIRANDPDNIIIVGTQTWSQDVDKAANNPLPYDNLMYAFHFYSATHDINTMKNKIQTALNAGLPIFVSEWGSSNVGTSYSNFDVADQWVAFMNEYNLSWANWSLGNKDEASSILSATAPMSGPWTDDDLSTAGLWIKPYFDAPDGTNSEIGNIAPIASDVTATVVAGETVNIALNGYDEDGSVASYSISTYPSNGSVYISGSDAVYTSNAGYEGSDSFTYFVTDNESAVSVAATITISVIAPSPTATPTPEPTATPTPEPTATPTPEPTATPTPEPTSTPTPVPTATPTAVPTATPTPVPTATPTAVPTATPEPTATPTAVPTATPTPEPTATPTPEPTPESVVSVSCSVTENAWNSGFVAVVSVTNTGTTAVTEWDVNIHVPEGEDFVGGWSAEFSRTGTTMNAKNVFYNGNLYPGQTASFGFQASFSGEHGSVYCIN